MEKRTYADRKRPSACEHCNDVFADKSALIKHQKRKHGRENKTRSTTAEKPKAVPHKFTVYKKRDCPVPGCPKFIATQGAADLHFRNKARTCEKHLKFHKLNLASGHGNSKEEETDCVKKVIKLNLNKFS
jgi:hypothetical protein